MWKIKDLYYDIKNFILNIIKWAPTLWHIRDWDAAYTYLVIQTHLKNVKRCIQKYGHHSDQTECILTLSYAIEYAQKLIDDMYEIEEIQKVEKIYGELTYTKEKDPNNKNYTILKYDEISEENRNARTEAYKIAKEKREKDKAILFNYLTKYIDTWWD